MINTVTVEEVTDEGSQGAGESRERKKRVMPKEGESHIKEESVSPTFSCVFFQNFFNRHL